MSQAHGFLPFPLALAKLSHCITELVWERKIEVASDMCGQNGRQVLKKRKTVQDDDDGGGGGMYLYSKEAEELETRPESQSLRFGGRRKWRRGRGSGWSRSM